MSTDRRAYMWQLADWINALRPTNKPYPLYAHGSIVENVNGRALVRIYTNRFHSRDTLGEMLKLMQSHFGEPDDSSSTSGLTVYEWTLGPTRSVQIIYRAGIGTFIQLFDKGVGDEE